MTCPNKTQIFTRVGPQNQHVRSVITLHTKIVVLSVSGLPVMKNGAFIVIHVLG